MDETNPYEKVMVRRLWLQSSHQPPQLLLALFKSSERIHGNCGFWIWPPHKPESGGQCGQVLSERFTDLKRICEELA